jgi:branched-chain amino acid transport system ATP-binding protein
LWQLVQRGRDRYLALVADRRGILVPSLVADRAVTSATRPGSTREERAPASPPGPDRARPPMLTVSGVEASYGPVQVLFGLDLEVERHEIVALLGTNGAGKSTLFRVITGLLPATCGTVTVDGEDLTNLATDEIATRGVVMMPGGRSVFPTMTVAENLSLAAWLMRKDQRAAEEAQDRVLELFPRLRERTNQLAGNLSGGEQQMLAISQALIPEPKLLLLDELSLGLAPSVVSSLVDVVHEVHATGLTIVVVEQSVDVALRLAERAVFMEKGEFRFTGPTRDLLDRPDVLRSVFLARAAADGGGPDGPEPRRRRPAASGSAAPDPDGSAVAGADRGSDPTLVLQCSGVSKRFGGITAVAGVDLELRDGQILGLIGPNGAGKTTLFDCISGFESVDSGTIALRGCDITDEPPHRRAALGLGRSFQEARLFPTLTTVEVIALACERHLWSRSMVANALGQPRSRRAELEVAEQVDAIVDRMGLDAYAHKLTGELSTGTRRIVELACLLASDPDVIVLDEPTGGVAQRETEALATVLLQVRDLTRTSMLVIDHDMGLLTSICDELCALDLGRVIASGPCADVLAHPLVVESYLGQVAMAGAST